LPDWLYRRLPSDVLPRPAAQNVRRPHQPPRLRSWAELLRLEAPAGLVGWVSAAPPNVLCRWPRAPSRTGRWRYSQAGKW